MSTRRTREVWRHRETGEAYLVDVEDDRVVTAEGPLADDELSADSLAMRRAAQGRSPAFTQEATDLDGRKDEFDRERLDI